MVSNVFLLFLRFGLSSMELHSPPFAAGFSSSCLVRFRRCSSDNCLCFVSKAALANFLLQRKQMYLEIAGNSWEMARNCKESKLRNSSLISWWKDERNCADCANHPKTSQNQSWISWESTHLYSRAPGSYVVRHLWKTEIHSSQRTAIGIGLPITEQALSRTAKRTVRFSLNTWNELLILAEDCQAESGLNSMGRKSAAIWCYFSFQSLIGYLILQFRSQEAEAQREHPFVKISSMAWAVRWFSQRTKHLFSSWGFRSQPYLITKRSGKSEASESFGKSN